MDAIRLVALKGAIGSGKSAAAELLAALRGYAILPLADSLKGGIEDLGGQSRWLNKVVDGLEGGHRVQWQLLGNECRLDVDNPLVWTSLVLMKARFLNHYLPLQGGPGRSRFAVPDVRHPEEVDELRRLVEGRWGGRVEVWEVVRPGLSACPRATAHSSERSADAIVADRVLDNSGSLADLAVRVQLLEGGHHEGGRP
jgi:hypothetical protein